MLLKIICIILLIYMNLIQTDSQIAELNETNAFLSINSQLKEIKAELARQGKYLNDSMNITGVNHNWFYATNCAEATASSKTNGIYNIRVPNYSEHPFSVACDATTQGGNWTIILKRYDGSVEFYRNWKSYKNGFGDLDGEFFLGLDKIHAMTAEYSQELLVVLEDFEGNEKFESYSKFAIGDENDQYALFTLGVSSGTGGDALKYHHGMKFSTFDRDNDVDPGNCAEKYTGAWWYKNGHHCNLAGRYKDNSFAKGITWYFFRGHEYSLKRAIMMIRPRKLGTI